MVKSRRRPTAAYNFRVALETLEVSKTTSPLSSEHEMYANPIRAGKGQLLEDGPRVRRKTWLGPRSTAPAKAHS